MAPLTAASPSGNSGPTRGCRAWGPGSAAAAGAYDLVIRGGRVLDPETGFDAVANVGIKDRTIARIATQALDAATIIDASGLVVAPGFIDLHSHGQDAENYRLKALDGVTSALELEIGVPDIRAFLKERQGRALVNFGATISHPAARAAAFGTPLGRGVLLPPSGPMTNNPATPEQLARMIAIVGEGLDAGALGVGMGITYTPGATRLEIIEMFRLAAARHLLAFTHVRGAGRIEPGSSIEAVEEVIGAAAISGAPLHIVHINSSCLKDVEVCLGMVEGARARGLDVTTEGYPYGAGMTAINSALFNPGWREKMNVDDKDVQMVDTGERLTKDTFDRYHASPEPRLALIYLNPDEIVDRVILHPLVMIASDGEIDKGKGHPRGVGTYARILGRYARSGRLTWMEAVRKMSLMPAQRLERATAAARRKGRVQEGADADLTIFDPRTVIDRATYESPTLPNEGINYVLVGGTVVVENGKAIESAMPGKAIVNDRAATR